MEAAREGHPDVIKCLLSHGADINGKDPKGCTALFYAVQSGNSNLETIKTLLDNGADPNAESIINNTTPFDDATFGGNKDFVEILIKHGAHGLESALTHACMEGNIDVVKVLLENNEEFDTFLHH